MTTRWRDNTTGKAPRGASGKRVNVRLRNGREGNWPVDGGRPATRWSLTDSPADIVQFRVVGDIE